MFPLAIVVGSIALVAGYMLLSKSSKQGGGSEARGKPEASPRSHPYVPPSTFVVGLGARRRRKESLTMSCSFWSLLLAPLSRSPSLPHDAAILTLTPPIPAYSEGVPVRKSASAAFLPSTGRGPALPVSSTSSGKLGMPSLPLTTLFGRGLIR